jgi:anti-sigma regulatory factor (Ser/Thr protein kinase)/DNA-binding HxlR family transcriptional regulator
MKQLIPSILKEFEKGRPLTTSHLSKKYKISRQGLHRYLSKLVRDGRILKQGSSPKTTYYILNKPQALRRIWKGEKRFQKKVQAFGLHEDLLLKEIESQKSLLDSLSEHAKINFAYAFTEMVNNAIDHSKTKFIDIDVKIRSGIVSFSVSDKGVGVFRNICDNKNLQNEMEAIEDILKGKQTTMPEKHSGEGIFFTSKIADRFVIESHGKRLTIDNLLDDAFVEDIRQKKGTRVYFEQKIDTRKKLDDVFHKYTSEDFQFKKSQVKVKLFSRGELYISRPQAKRLVHAMDQFEEIILDFKDVETIGQAFADEVFRIFQADHPEIRIIPINCSENVEFMIKRAKS